MVGESKASHGARPVERTTTLADSQAAGRGTTDLSLMLGSSVEPTICHTPRPRRWSNQEFLVRPLKSILLSNPPYSAVSQMAPELGM